MGLANTVIFQYGLSSVFIPLICSNIKLIYIDCGLENWNKSLLTSLRKRCSFVKANFDKRNRIRLNVKHLIRALENKKRNIFLLKPQYINVAIDDLEEMMIYEKGSTQYKSKTLKRADNIRLYE